MTADGRSFRLDGVSLTYGTHPALADITLEIEAGALLACVGPSGAGKTSLLRILGGAIAPTRGEVRIGGSELHHLGPRALRAVRSRIGFIHQDLALVPQLRVLQNVLAGRLGRQSFVGSLTRMIRPRPTDVEQVHAILARVGIEEKLYQRTDRLSGGQQQRVAIARALYQDPIALLADEPVASVDPARARDTVALLRDLSQERGMTLVLSLHDLALAREFFPRLIGLREGRVQLDRVAADCDDEPFEALYRMVPARPHPYGP